MRKAMSNPPPASRAVIEKRAYELWQAAGCPSGCALDHWLKAEAELAAKTPPAARSGAAAIAALKPRTRKPRKAKS
ncbi:MAG: DUF2934 domain-containing protein [Pseudomonadota bacterium]